LQRVPPWLQTAQNGRPAGFHQRSHWQNIQLLFRAKGTRIFDYGAKTPKHSVHFIRQVRRMQPEMEIPFLPNSRIKAFYGTLDS
jgi:hypothetical protein